MVEFTNGIIATFKGDVPEVVTSVVLGIIVLELGLVSGAISGVAPVVAVNTRAIARKTVKRKSFGIVEIFLRFIMNFGRSKCHNNGKYREDIAMKNIRAPLAVFLLVVLMYITAEIIHDKEIIFPEIAALAVGAWYVKNSPWKEKPVYLWLSPTLAAMTGVCVLHFLPYPRELLIAATFILIALQLFVLRSNVLPSISAAILPIVINSDSLYYVLAVSILSAIIAVGRGILNYFQTKANLAHQSVLPLKVNEQKPPGERVLLHWMQLFLGVSIVAIIAFRCNLPYMIAPPLIVAFIEFTNPRSKLGKQPERLFGLILCTAVSGALLLYFLHFQWLWPVWLVAGCIVLWSLFLFQQFKLILPPAIAIALLPTIIPAAMLPVYPFAIAVGIGVFIFFGKLMAIYSNAQAMSIGTPSDSN